MLNLDKSFFNLSGLSVSHGSCSIGYNNEGSKRINILVAAGHLVTGPVLVHCHIGLFSVISHLVVEAVLWFLIKCFKICTSTDFCDLLSRSITKSFLGCTKTQRGGQQNKDKLKKENNSVDFRRIPNERVVNICISLVKYFNLYYQNLDRDLKQTKQKQYH